MIARLAGRVLTGGAMSVGGAPIWLWAIGGVLLAFGVTVAAWRLEVAGLQVLLANAGTALQAEKTGRAQDREQVADATAKKEKANADETYRRMEIQARNDAAKEAQLAQARRDRDAARVAGDDLQLRVDVLLRSLDSERRPADPAPEGECKAARAATHLLADVLRRADEEAGVLADYADRARIAGQQCSADYDALTLKLSKP